METIVSLATPAGNSGVAVIRISGENSKNILQKLIKEDIEFEPRKMYLKNVYFGDLMDKSLVVFFAHPFSFTGEDVAEIQSHGGYFIANKIIDEILNLGARSAGAGEFSKRAFINGKISLDQAEGIVDLINAETEMQAKCGGDLLNGTLKDKINSIQNKLTEILAEIEAKLDYPEYEYTDRESSDIKTKIIDIHNELNLLIEDCKNGLLVKNGVKVAIIGSPNVGKSSLLNTLTKSDKAIVTDIAGTTRDIVEAEYEYNGIIFRLFDTAGIHDSQDKVEKIGIDRAKKILDECDLALKISTKDENCIIDTKIPYINVLNKIDTAKDINKELYDICVSAKTLENIDELKNIIFKKTINGEINQNKFYLTNTRHVECVKNTIKFLNNTINNFDNKTFDIISDELKSAWRSLGEISGIVSDETIIDKIFSKFCLGK